jgi:hypothetical protein
MGRPSQLYEQLAFGWLLIALRCLYLYQQVSLPQLSQFLYHIIGIS